VPFEALTLDSGELWVQKFEIGYLPYAGMIAESRQSDRWAAPWRVMLSAFADPGPAPASGKQWAPLPQARREVEGIANLSGARARLHTGADARKRWLLLAGQAPVLHLATHASANLDNPDASYLLFAPDFAKEPSYDSLYLKEVYRLPLSTVDLVTLSACETEAGKLVGGEGEQGFGQAFLAAGARTVVSSLWRVDDEASAQWMLRFYRKLWSGQSVASAMRATKLEFLSGATSAHPAYWAAFVATGDSGLRLPRVIRWTWIAVAFAFLIGATAIAIRKLAGKR
jgi:CHAT domain-containing protein